MQRVFWLKITLITFFGLFSLNVPASDTAKEKRWSDQIVDSLMVGDAQWLTANDQKFLAIYAEHTTAKAQGAAIVIHGSGVHPNWPDVVYPLRTQLPDHGWQTLSIQMPILANDANYKEYAPLFVEIAPRINAAIAFLRSKGISNIVIVAHSLGSTMSGYYLAKNPNSGVKAFVAVGVPGILFDDNERDFLQSLKTINIPVLDIFGSRDLDGVLASADQKAKVARKAGNKHYNQLKVDGANHFFVDKQDDLVKRVRGWLKTNAAGKEISRK